jgi:hypothetical protein
MMAQSRIGLNIHGANISDKPRLIAYLQATQPRWTLVMDSLDVAREIKVALPACNVIFRAWPDDELVKQVTPEQWVTDTIARLQGADLWAYGGNEMGFSDDVLTWTARVIEQASMRGLKVVVGNFSSGTPNADDFRRPAARWVLDLLDKHRETTVLGLHQYACGVITSGFIGGEPGFIQPETWPRNVADVTMWHCGRDRQLFEACDRMAIRAPRVVLTEHGFDDMSDIKFWSERLIKTPPYMTVRGWKTLWNQWRAWWPRWTPEKAYFEQLKYANEVIYKDTPVEAQLIFCWGASSSRWESFDMSEAREMQELLKVYAAESTAPVEPPARVYEPDTYIYAGVSNYNIRVDAGTASASTGNWLRTGDTVKVLDEQAKKPDIHTWQKVTVVPAIAANLAVTGWIAVSDISLTPKPADPPAPPTPAPIIPLFTRAELEALAQHHEAIAAILRTAAERAAA